MDVIALDNLAGLTNEQGFLLDMAVWNEQIACQLAYSNQIQLTEQHWEIIYFIRDYYKQFKHLPNARVFSKAISKTLGVEKASSRYLQKLFPEGPLKYACKLAGLPKPPTCL
ncbi:MAG: TusE/DsrC/DsvC family sulfur relay protein [Methylococcaceae bacterium]|jgi:tRNA 2-thiouridine synthesizing protein E